ncbi:hypothetical protein GKE82_20255 [Conexibacter sp. W3-3-2]|uniref:Uncharacterized protein n=1 Tax=Paraconexibacter algicola TaxID=2133960 RepID=A0A2T4ULT4_9ACTN|nr:MULTISPECIES: hypothetical protein [Solirubrobacterales]MTD46556.1 hypothetical protein [Conexibacter sp. W3-3-2]PTL60196.1 hypothetical protein C7Y72_11390 [Paraconexibacter algicola]
MDQQHDPHDGAEELLRRALIDPDTSAALALRVDGLSLAEALTVIFHGRLDLGTVQTYVAPGGFGAGAAVAPSALLRVPCDLDLADAPDAEGAHDLYAEQARALRDALLAADTVLALWKDALEALADAPVGVDRSIELGVRLPAHRLMPVALVAPEQRLTVVPVCGARTLAEGRPPLGIACAQQDVAHVYPLPDDPERCLEDFRERAADHARRLADQLEHQEQSVRRFLEISGVDDLPEAC